MYNMRIQVNDTAVRLYCVLALYWHSVFERQQAAMRAPAHKYAALLRRSQPRLRHATLNMAQERRAQLLEQQRGLW